jgi:acyl carrier protein
MRAAENIDKIKGEIREFLTPIAQRVGVESFADGDSLTAAGVLSSLVLFRVVSFLEETFSISIDDDEINIENFDSIDKIQCLVVSNLPGSL